MKKLSAIVLMLFVAACDGDAPQDTHSDGSDSSEQGNASADDDSGGAVDPTGSTSQTTVTRQITAAEGGEVSLPGATLAIPAGSLAADTEISISIRDSSEFAAPEGGIHGDTFEFGPDGLTFNSPVSLALDFEGTPPEGQSAVVATWDGTRWVELEGSSVSGRTVTATTTHFSVYTVIFRINGNDVGFGTCNAEEFQGCGGDMTGVWSLTGGCMTFGGNPFGGCTGAAITIDVQVDGNVTVNADQTYSIDLMLGADIRFSVPKTCLPPDEGCDEVDENAVEENGYCVAVDQAEDASTEVGTWTIEGDQVCFLESDETEPSCLIYCVEGDTVRLAEFDTESGRSRIYEAQR